jgi:hypothetical protein
LNLFEPLDPLAPWDYNAMIKPAQEAVQTHDIISRLLAWEVIVDDRGHKAEAGLVWFSYRLNETVAWALADVYRVPDVSSEWQLSFIFDSPWQPLQVYRSPPTNEDVYTFGAPHWKFGPPPEGYKYLQAHVCDHAWRQAIGSAPTRHYPGEKIQGDKAP